MLLSNTYLNFLFILALNVAGCSPKETHNIKAIGYVIGAAENEESRSLANQTFTELQNRTSDDIVIYQNEKPIPKGYKTLFFEVNSDLKSDYCIENNKDGISISIRNNDNASWMMYQLIDALAKEDNRFDSSDLPPAILDFQKTCNNFDFVYREPHFPSNTKLENNLKLGTQNVDNDWGLWGHNLPKVINDDSDTTIYALWNDERNEDQFCFTSEILKQQFIDYVIDNFGEGEEKGYHFMVMPNDNSISCTCSNCSAVGNTTKNATPAVSQFIEEMANRFPKHQFFTSSYLTTQQLPDSKLPKNTGVFISTIELPRGIELTENQPATKRFIQEVDAWKNITNNVYVWDYASNFDDYLSPIPVLYGLQKQLAFFKEKGINGIFLNASGYDYSSFEDLKTYVSSVLMIDIHADIDALCTNFYRKYYPENHKLLTNYYLTLEKDFESKHKAYNMYGGIVEALSTYLDHKEFIEFYNSLKTSILIAKGDEKKSLEKLYTALHFTKLQIAYNNIDRTDGFANLNKNSLKTNKETKTTIKNFEKLLIYPDLTSYKEEKGLLTDYIKNWNEFIVNTSLKNEILNRKIKILSTPDEGYESASQLTDGVPGFENDYHQGWYISNNDLRLEFSAENLKGSKEVELRFLNDRKHRFSPPKKIEIKVDSELLETITNIDLAMDSNIVEVKFPINFPEGKTIEFNFIRNSENGDKLACDEIRIL